MKQIVVVMTEERDRESKMTLYMFRSISYSIPFLCDCLKMKLGYVLLGCCEVGMQMDFLFLLIRTKMLHNQYRPRGTKPPFCAYVLLKMKDQSSQKSSSFWARNVRRKIQKQENITNRDLRH